MPADLICQSLQTILRITLDGTWVSDRISSSENKGDGAAARGDSAFCCPARGYDKFIIRQIGHSVPDTEKGGKYCPDVNFNKKITEVSMISPIENHRVIIYNNDNLL